MRHFRLQPLSWGPVRTPAVHRKYWVINIQTEKHNLRTWEQKTRKRKLLGREKHFRLQWKYMKCRWCIKSYLYYTNHVRDTGVLIVYWSALLLQVINRFLLNTGHFRNAHCSGTRWEGRCPKASQFQKRVTLQLTRRERQGYLSYPWFQKPWNPAYEN